MNDPVRLRPRGMSVKDDWRAWLPEEKSQVFHRQVHRLESSYAMLSVSLDEAIELRHLGHAGKSLQAVGITSDLCKLLTETLAGLLRALSEHAEQYGTIPNAAPLDPANFQGPRGQRSARLSNLLNHVLLSQPRPFAAEPPLFSKAMTSARSKTCAEAGAPSTLSRLRYERDAPKFRTQT